MCISIIVLSIIAIFIFTPVEFGANSTLGLVKIHGTNNELSTQWIIHIGGTRETNYTGGLRIPFYVFVFGILGGYLRYLYTIAYPEKEDKFSNSMMRPRSPSLLEEVDAAETDTKQFLNTTIKIIALIVLAPLLAIAAWFVVSGQGQSTNVPILAALSLAIGLVTKEVVEGLISFAKGHLPSAATPSTSTTETEEVKLSNAKVQILLDKFPDTKNIHQVSLEYSIRKVKDTFGGSSDVLVVKDDGKPLGILYKQDLNSILPAEKDMKEPDYERKLGVVIGDISNEFITKSKWDKDKDMKNYAEVRADDNLLLARERMYAKSSEVNDIRCLVVDQTTGKAVAIFSFDSIAASLTK